MNNLTSLTTLLFFLFGQTLSAQTHVVTTSDDYVTGSLRHWVTNSSANDTIVFDPSILANGSDTIKVDFPIIFNHGLTIKGLFVGGDTLYLSGQDSSRIFYMDFEGVSGVEMYMEDLAIIEGNQYVSDPLQYKNNGGAVMAYEVAVLKITNSIIRNNRVKGFGRGGAFFVFQCPEVVIENCVVDNNHTPDSIYDNTHAGGHGGGFYINSALSGGFVEINNSAFINNTSYDRGGGAYIFGPRFIINESKFINNHIMNDSPNHILYGGGLYYKSDTLANMTNCVFKGNSAEHGGGLLMGKMLYGTPPNSVTIDGCLFENNISGDEGGGILLGGANLVLLNSSFIGNIAGGRGGALLLSSGSSLLGSQNIQNCTFIGNDSPLGSAIEFYRPDAQLVNSTMVSGGSSTNGALLSVFNGFSGSVFMRNSICDAGSGLPTYSDASYFSSQGYNIFSDNPTFSVGTDQVNISTVTLDLEPLGNYGGTTPTMIPSATSPALNAGDPTDFSDAQNSPIYGVRDVGAAERQTISTDTSLVCGPITWWGNTYSQAGTYTDSAYNAMGTLDSTGVLVLSEINDSATTKNPYLVALEQSVGTTYQWIDCNNPLVTLTGATDSIYQPTTNGSYAVIISLGGCVDTSNCVVYNQVSLDENVFPEQWMTFYPNPTNGSITVKGLDKNSLPTSLAIMDLSGRPLHEMTIPSERIQLPPLAEGMYLLKFSGEDGLVQVERVVVRR